MKKTISVLMAIMLIFSLSACSEKPLAKIGDKTVTEKDVQAEFEAAQKQVLENYAYYYLIDKFYEDTPVTDAELKERINSIKEQYSDQWDEYLAYFGYSDERDFERATRLDMQREKKIEELAASIDIDDSYLEDMYNANPSYYQYTDLDAIFFDDKETKDKAWELIQKGATLEEAAQELGLEVSKNEKAPIYYTEFEKTLDQYNEGDIIKTNDDSSAYIIVKINKNYISFDDVKDVVKEDCIESAAASELDQKIEEFFKSQTVEIQGKSVDATTLIIGTSN